MLCELPKQSLDRVRHLLAPFSHYLVLTTILKGVTPGRIWVDDPQRPGTALVWDMLNMLFFLAGDPADARVSRDLNGLIRETILPVLAARRYGDLHIQFSPGTWDDYVDIILAGTTTAREAICHFALRPEDRDRRGDRRTGVPAGYRVVRITPELVGDTDFENAAEVARCIRACWGSLDRYQREGGLGYCVLHDRAVASWCSTDYVVGDQCELYVESFGEHRGRGLGTLVASACLEACLERGLTAHWHCWAGNIGSVRIAENLGMVRMADCPVFVASPEAEDQVA